MGKWNKYVKTIPIGLYGITDIYNTIARYTTAQNGTQLFSFQPNEATSTIIVYFAQANTYIDTDNVANSIMPILGFAGEAFIKRNLRVPLVGRESL